MLIQLVKLSPVRDSRTVGAWDLNESTRPENVQGQEHPQSTPRPPRLTRVGGMTHCLVRSPIEVQKLFDIYRQFQASLGSSLVTLSRWGFSLQVGFVQTAWLVQSRPSIRNIPHPSIDRLSTVRLELKMFRSILSLDIIATRLICLKQSRTIPRMRDWLFWAISGLLVAP